ncbi:hypothetical protein OVY01_00135 [Robbsia sp. Bb-Pol-6]|uniref:Peptidoglycan binding protein n=1 Tax=Robbsia betulipollinis TaxID=2981849 RepID=A0ABT3ZGM2_9BURK|nr:glycosyl hydrolase 108 family protein [Robbsia betulipollinis]MCY0385673.1 hypothetical protein [Robbsia betulipollinis]
MIPDDLIVKVLATEKGYVNDPADAGGETNFGITIAVARAFGYTGPMKSMTRDTAIAIYRARYWTQPHFDQIAAVDLPLASNLFDGGVNMGPATAVAWMQRALNVLNAQGASFPDIVVDGGAGAMTLAALRMYKTQRGAPGMAVLLEMVRALRRVAYIQIAENKPINEKFEYGWQQRVSQGVTS